MFRFLLCVILLSLNTVEAFSPAVKALGRTPGRWYGLVKVAVRSQDPESIIRLVSKAHSHNSSYAKKAEMALFKMGAITHFAVLRNQISHMDTFLKNRFGC